MSEVSECLSAFCKFCYCPDCATFPQKTLGLRQAWRDDGTLTFPEVNSRLRTRTALLQAAASRSKGQYILPGDRVNWKKHPSDGSYRKTRTRCLTPLLSHSRKGGVEVSDSLPAGEASPAAPCFYQQSSKGSLIATHRAIGSAPTSSEQNWGSQEAQAQVSQPMTWLNRHSKGAKAPANSSGWKNAVVSYAELLKYTDSVNVN